MAISVTCDDCGASYQVADTLDGKKVRCRECDAVLVVDSEAPAPRRAAKPRSAAESRIKSSRAEPSPRPRRPRRDRDEDDEDEAPRRIKKKKSGPPLALILIGAGAALFLFLICGGVLAYVMVFSGRVSNSSPSPVAVVTVPAAPALPQPPPQPDAPNPNQNQNQNQNPQPAPNFPPPPDPFAQPAPNFQPPAFPVQAPPPPMVEWRVQPDPTPPEQAAAVNPKGTFPITTFSQSVLFPTTPSAFMAVGVKSGVFDAFQVLNLKTMKTSGVPVQMNSQKIALSPDGAHFAAGGLGAGKTIVDVWSVADGRNGKIVVDDKPLFLQMVDFAGPGRVLTLKSEGAEEVGQIWDVKSGLEVRSFRAASHADNKQAAVSAGRKYLALFGGANDRVLVYDLTTGQPAGDLPVAPNSQCQGLAFSPDGKSFAGLFGTGLSSRLETWDLATGKPTGEHPVEKLPQNTFFYKGQALEWLQDGGLMMYGQMLVDGNSGGVYWKLPTGALDGEPRRMFGAACVACVKGEANKKSLQFETLPEDKVAAALKAAQAGQDPATAAMPALKPADLAGVKELPAPAGAVAWSATADAAPAVKGVLGKNPMPLTGKGAGVQRILFTRPDVGQAAVVSVPEAAGLSASQPVHVDRFDLAAGKHLGGADLFSTEMPKQAPGMPGQPARLQADLSPDGTLLAVCEPKTGKRVDVWATAENKHVVGWAPYEKEGDGRVHWLAFLDAKHLLTLGGVGKLTLWEVPECKAIYTVTFARDLPALSPGRKYLTAFSGSSFEVLEAATGARVGQMARANASGAWASAYSRDGREFAAVLTTGEGPRLVRWDATAGAVKDEFPITPGGNELQWYGPDHILYGSTLFDLNLKWPTALYTLPGQGRLASDSPDGRLWFVAARNANDPAMLSAETLPDAGTRQVAQQAAAGNAKVLLGPGTAVKVSVQGAAGPGANADTFHRDVANRQGQHLQTLGFKTAADAPVTLTIQFQPARDTGETRSYKAIGRLRQNLDVHVIEVTATATLTDAGGAVVWTQQNKAVTPIIVSINSEDNFQDAVNKAVWNMAAGWAGAVAPPPVLLRTGGGVEGLPRSVLLTGDR